MSFTEPKNTREFYWTDHVKYKMRQYGLSSQRVLGVIRRPDRKEVGIVKKTIAVMKPVSAKLVAGKSVWKSEIWVMYQLKGQNSLGRVQNLAKSQICIISAWKYPGISPDRNPIPEEILRDIENIV